MGTNSGMAARLALPLAVLVVACVGCVSPWRQPPPPAEPELSLQDRERYAQAEGTLHSADAAAREQAAVALLSMEHPAALDLVLRTIAEDESPDVRVSVIRAAAFYADHRCFETILQAIDAPDADVRAAAATALARFTQPGEVDAMAELIQRRSTTAEQKRLVFEALGDGLAVRATPVLIQGLSSADEAVRTAALAALRRISGRQLPPDVGQWTQWWETNSHRSREEILEEHLRSLSQELTDRVHALEDLEEQQRELMALAGSPESETPRMLLAALGSRHPAVRQYASFRLAALGKDKLAGMRIDDRETYEVLRLALDDESGNVRHNVIRFAVGLPGTYRDDLVRKALGDENPDVLVVAIEAVGPGTDDGVVGRLQELLSTSPHEKVRRAAANMLGKVGAAGSVPVLMAALDDGEENVRWFAVEGLRKLSAVQASPRICEVLLSDQSPRVREIAASALGELGQPVGVPALRQALADANERVREKAASSLLALATDNYERMAVIADAFREQRLYDPARQVLGRMIERAEGEPQAKARLSDAYRQLAEVQQEDADYAAAARTWEKLDALLGGDVSVRRKLVGCWLQAEQSSSLVSAVDVWLRDADPVEDEALVEVVVEAAETLLEAGKQGEARTVLVAAAAATNDGTGPRLLARIARLQRQLGESEAAP